MRDAYCFGMMLSEDQCYQAVLTRDARFDGRLFVAVRSTRIYCRPICRVKTPMRKNCTFYRNAAAAEVAGYRPCKRCRPELAPGNSPMDASSRLARAAAFHIEQDFLAEHSLEDLAGKLGVSDRQVRRVFQEEFGVAPVEFWQTQRLLLAKQLLTDSRMPIISVAMASGFQSLRRFNALLKQRYRLTPSELRRQQKKDITEQFSEFSFCLGYRPPFDWERLLGFLAMRAIPHVEFVRDGCYFRTVRIQRERKTFNGYIQIRHDASRHALLVYMSDSLRPVCGVVLGRVKHLFDLAADSAAIEAVLKPLGNIRPGLRLPGCFDGFEMAVRAVLGQQISVAGARTLAGRIAEKFGMPISTPYSELTHVFPSAQRMATASVDEIAKLGINGRRSQTIIELAKAISNEELHLSPGSAVDETLERLRQIPGIGEWTAQYIAMRSLAWPDAFVHTDLGVRKSLGEDDPKKILQLAEKWRPWRAYAVLHLWTNTNPH